jgi:sugar phosphate isomerase/epimerase
MLHSPYIVGAALPVSQLEAHRDWLVERQRDLEIQDPFRPEVLDGDWRAVARQVRRLLTGYSGRLGIHGPFDGLVLASSDLRVQQVATERLQQGLDFAEEVGATHMVVHSPWRNLGHYFIPISPYYTLADAIDRAHRVLDPLVRRAEGIGCTLVIENIYDTHPGPWIDLITSFGSDLVRASVDVGHAYIMHQAGGAPPDAFVRTAGVLLGHVHLQDTDGLSDRHWAPGDGEINWFALFDALRAFNGSPRLILELHDCSRVRDGAAWLAARGFVA